MVEDSTPSVGHLTQPGDHEVRVPAVSVIAAGGLLLLLLLSPAVGFWWLRDMAAESAERNAIGHARDMLIRHFARTHGRWPREWDDLAEDFEAANAGYGTAGLDELKQVVGIDFHFDPASLLAGDANPKPPPRLLWLTGRPDTEDVREANARLIAFLRRRMESSRSHQISIIPETTTIPQ